MHAVYNQANIRIPGTSDMGGNDTVVSLLSCPEITENVEFLKCEQSKKVRANFFPNIPLPSAQIPFYGKS